MTVFPPHPLQPYPPLIINAALTGMVGDPRRLPTLPVTAEQIISDGTACFRAGATILHLHARDSELKPNWRRAAYEEVIPALRRECPGVVICVTTSGRVEGDVSKRADVLGLTGEAKPDMASLTLGSLNFRDAASVNDPEVVVTLARMMIERDIRPELEIFDLGMTVVLHRLLGESILKPPSYANLIMGSHNSAPATAAALSFLVDHLPPNTTWAAAGIGPFQLPMNAMAMFMGGHVRTGLEDNPYLNHSPRSAATNVELVRRIVDLAAIAGRSLAAPAQTRDMLGLGG